MSWLWRPWLVSQDRSRVRPLALVILIADLGVQHSRLTAHQVALVRYRSLSPHSHSDFLTISFSRIKVTTHTLGFISPTLCVYKGVRARSAVFDSRISHQVNARAYQSSYSPHAPVLSSLGGDLRV